MAVFAKGHLCNSYPWPSGLNFYQKRSLKSRFSLGDACPQTPFSGCTLHAFCAK